MIYSKIIGVRFNKVGKVYDFSAEGFDIAKGDFVIVETSRGRQIGEVVIVTENFSTENDSIKPIIDIATPREMVNRELLNQQEDEILQYAKNRANELQIAGVKFLNASYSYDGTRMLVTYSSVNDEKIETKTLRYDIQKAFSPVTNVELRQLGPRDVAKITTGMGACGMALRCCSSYLTEFNSISIKMAKEQGISLTPAEITGMCGRLRCCLGFENDYYVECRKSLPKRNKRVTTPHGEGKVVEVYPLRQSVLVDIPDVGKREFKIDEITVEDTPKQVSPDEKTDTKPKP